MLKLVTAAAPVKQETLGMIEQLVPHAVHKTLRTGSDSWIVDDDIADPELLRGFLRGVGVPSRIRQAPSYIQRMEHTELLDRLKKLRQLSRDLAAQIPHMTPANRRYMTAALQTLAREQDPDLMTWGRRVPPNLSRVLARSARIRHQQAEALCQIYGRIKR